MKSLFIMLILGFLAGCVPATQPVDQPVSLHNTTPDLVDNDSSTPLVPQQEW